MLDGDGTVVAGEGDDEILITSQGALARCGPGDDHADGVGDDDDVRDCERLNFSRADERDARFHVRGRAVLTNLDCDCRRARYVARFRDVIIAEARGRPRALRLNARGRALLAERGRLRITIGIRHEFEEVSNESEFRTVIRR